MITIIVDSEEEKEAILKESEYIHYLKDLDTDIASLLPHLYMNPGIILVARSRTAPLQTLSKGYVYAPYVPEFKLKCGSCRYFWRDNSEDEVGCCTNKKVCPDEVHNTRASNKEPITDDCFSINVRY